MPKKGEKNPLIVKCNNATHSLSEALKYEYITIKIWYIIMITHNDFIKIQSVLQRSRDIFLKHPVVLFQCLIGSWRQSDWAEIPNIKLRYCTRSHSTPDFTGCQVLVLLGGFPFWFDLHVLRETQHSSLGQFGVDRGRKLLP